MVTVSKVVHGLELLVNDANACLVCAVGNFFDVLDRLSELGQLFVNNLSSLDSCLRVELSWNNQLHPENSGINGV
jgi:hypothetical protein